jgi:hypothetical protein
MLKKSLQGSRTPRGIKRKTNCVFSASACYSLNCLKRKANEVEVKKKDTRNFNLLIWQNTVILRHQRIPGGMGQAQMPAYNKIILALHSRIFHENLLPHWSLFYVAEPGIF